MSTATDLAEIESAIADAELGDTEAERVKELVGEGISLDAAIETAIAERGGDDPARHEGPPIPEAAPAYVVDEKKVEKEIERHLNRMAELLGPTAEQYQPCEECGAAGILIPGPKMIANPKYRQCPTCVGYGQVLTGSRNPQMVSQPCPTCMGRGFQEAVSEGQQPVTPIVAPVETTDGFGNPAWMGDPGVRPAGPTSWQ